MDKTKTPMGARRLKQWVDRPLIQQAEIAKRHDAVDQFYIISLSVTRYVTI